MVDAHEMKDLAGGRRLSYKNQHRAIAFDH